MKPNEGLADIVLQCAPTMSKEIDLLQTAPSNTQNIVNDIRRFRESPIDFLATLGRHAVGTQWRSYDECIGQTLYYPGLSDSIRKKTMAHNAVQQRINQLVQMKMKSEQSWSLTQNERLARTTQYREWITQVADNMVSKMMCTFDHRSVLQAAYYVVAQLLSRAYNQGVHVRADEIERLKAKALELQEKKQSMVFLPCHKSHVDYIAIQFICFRFGISLPTVVAGDNLNFAVIGQFLQQVGAMFIRRGNWSEDYLYPGAAQAYIETILQQGYNFECFIEGGRSRTGKLLPPKLGILKYILDGLLSGAVQDTFIVPVSTQYDKVAEAGAYATELLGSEKKKESFWSFLESRNITSLQMGRVDVRFDEPWSLREYVTDQLRLFAITTNSSTPLYVTLPSPQVNPTASPVIHPIELSPEIHIRLLRTLGYKVLRDINKLSEVMPTALVGTVLLTWSGRGISRSQLIRKVEFLIEKVEGAGGKVNLAGHTSVEPLIDNALKVLGSSLVGSITEKGSLLETVYFPKDRFNLSYYRNQVIHLFVDEAIASVAIFTELRKHQILKLDKAPIISTTEFLSSLLAGEFVFEGNSLKVSLDKALKKLEKQDVLHYTGDSIEMSSTEFEQGCETFDFYCYLIWPFIDGYWCSSVALYMLNQPIQERTFYKRTQSLAKTLYHEGEITYYEAVNIQVLKVALENFEVRGLVERITVEENGKEVVQFKLADDWRPEVIDGQFALFGKLYQHSELIARSRNQPLRNGLTAALSPRILKLCNTVGSAVKL